MLRRCRLTVGVLLGISGSACYLVPNPALDDDGSTGSTGATEGDTDGGELALDCDALPLTANEATLDFTPLAAGLVAGIDYAYAAEGLPEGLSIDATTGQITGTVLADPGEHVFSITIQGQGEEGEPTVAQTECTLSVNPRISASLPVDALPYCLQSSDSLLDLVTAGTGDGTPISCRFTYTGGSGRKPNGIEVDADSCTLTGSIDEDRLGTWVFTVEGRQSGASVFVPFCVTNDVPQGYDVTVDHSGTTNAPLLPLTRTYDPTTSFSVGSDGDPRISVIAPGVCGASCYYGYTFLRSMAPIADDGFTLDPDGPLEDAMMNRIGFFHEMRVSGPAVPDEFRERPWVLSASIYYCLTDQMGGCGDPQNDGDGALELALIMVPDTL